MNKRWRPSVTVAAVIEHEGRFLLVEEHTPEGLRLNNPAGHLEPGETPQSAVVREALEETGREFVPEALLGVYLARFVRPRAARPGRRGRGGRAEDAMQPRPPEDITYLRIAYSGRVGDPIADRTLDPSIVRTLWLTRDEIAAEAARLRSPLVMRCIDDHLAGRRLPLDAVVGDASLAEPAQLEPLAQASPEAGGEAAEEAGGEGGRDATTPSRSARRRARLKMRRMEEQSTGPSHTEAEPLDAASSGVEGAVAEGAQAMPDAAAGAAPATGTPGAPATDAPASPEAQSASTPAITPAARETKTPRPPEPTLAETTAALAERFPALFTPGQARPIKLRIQSDIQERTQGAFTRRQLSVFLHRHTTSTAYLRALVASPQRFDLDGRPAGEVAAEHVEAAKVELERRRQIVMQRRQGQEARGPREAREPGATQAAHGAQGPHGGQGPRADRPDRPDRPPRPPRADRPSRPAGPARAGGPERGPRPGVAGAADRPPRGDRPPGDRPFARGPDRRADRPGDRPFDRSSDRSTDRPADRGEPAFALPEDPERRERALLLRSFEGSPLTAANFCALKGLALGDFESQIATARREREERQRAASSGH
ncbi:MAG: NUDIX domain-containing protein [Rubrivivax sp.]|nr:NUDIX domain-containing protein [Rubrivivax sp.]